MAERITEIAKGKWLPPTGTEPDSVVERRMRAEVEEATAPAEPAVRSPA